MIRTGRFWLCLAALCAVGGASASAQGRVVVVGVDSGSWNLIDAGIDRGELPQLAALLREGAHAELETVEPVISPTVWTSIATGRSPGAHGITSFRMTSGDIRVPTLWERLAAQGITVGLYDYLVTWPPRPRPGGFTIPGWLRRDERVEPHDVFERAGVDRFAYSTRGVLAPERIFANALRELEAKPEHFLRLLEAFDPAVAVVTFYALDAISHRFWHDVFPEDFDGSAPPPDPKFRTAIPQVLAGIDAALGRIRESLGPNDSLLVLSDHGALALSDGFERRWRFDIEHLLEAIGVDPERDHFRVIRDWRKVVIEIERGDYADREETLRQWVAQASALRTASGEALFEVEVGRTAFAPDPLERWRQRIEDAVWGASDKWRNPEMHAMVVLKPHEQLLQQVWPDAPVLTKSGQWPSGELFHPVDFSGTHDPIGIFIAAGRGIEPRSERGRINVLEVAPLVAYLAGAAIPDDLEAALPRDWIQTGYLAEHPVRTGPAQSMRLDPDEYAPAALDEESEADLTERLRALGYAE